MNYDEFAFFNQQLAAMVRDGIPLEGAMQRLSAEMRDGPLRKELAELGADLAKGTPLREAIQQRKLPDLYRQMLEVGAQTNDLPGVLTLLADHYQRRQLIWTRLKGLMVYPSIVLIAALVLSCFLSVLLSLFLHSTVDAMPFGHVNTPWAFVGLWLAPVLVSVTCLTLLVLAAIPRMRRAARWRLPALKEANLAQVASALSLMLKAGVPLDKALSLMHQLELGTPAEGELAVWRQRLANGHGKFSDMVADSRVFPPLFVWMVGQSGEDLRTGFQRAAEFYSARAAYRTENILYAVLPCAVAVLGLMIMFQIHPVIVEFVQLMDGIGGDSIK